MRLYAFDSIPDEAMEDMQHPAWDRLFIQQGGFRTLPWRVTERLHTPKKKRKKKDHRAIRHD